MADTILFSALLVAATACWLCAGVFGAFSDFLTRSFAAMPAPAGIAAMQSINRVIYRSAFVFFLIALVPLSAFIAAFALLYPAAGWSLALAGAAVYLLGVMGTTGFGNIPMNERLDKMDPATDEAASYWQVYLRRWTRLNHLRSLACVIAALLYSGALVMLP